MLVVGIVAGVYSGKLDHINYAENVQLESIITGINKASSQIKKRGDPWILELEHRVRATGTVVTWVLFYSEIAYAVMSREPIACIDEGEPNAT